MSGMGIDVLLDATADMPQIPLIEELAAKHYPDRTIRHFAG